MRSLVCLLLFLLASSCATLGGGEGSSKAGKITVKPSELDKKFASLDKSPAMQAEGRRVEFGKVGQKEYDAFLKEAAKNVLVVSMTDATLENIEHAAQGLAGQQPGPVSDYDALGKAVGEKHATLTKAQVEEIRDQLELLDNLVKALKETPTRAAALAESGKALSSKAADAMATNPLGMLNSVLEIASAMGRVASTAATGVPSVGKRAADVFRLLAMCRCTNTEVPLTPADVSPKFASMFPADAFSAENTRVEYVVTDIEKFDSIFRDVARLRGTVLLAQVWTNEVSKTIAELTGGSVPTNADELRTAVASIDKKRLKAAVGLPAKLKTHLQQLQAILSELQNVPAVGQGLTAKIQGIGPAAAEAALTSPARMAGLPSAVQSTVEQTADSLQRAAASLTALSAMVAPLKALAG